MNAIFSEISHEIASKATDRLHELKKMHLIDDYQEDWDDKQKSEFASPLDELVNDLTD